MSKRIDNNYLHAGSGSSSIPADDDDLQCFCRHGWYIIVFVVDGADHQQYNCVASCSVIILIDPQIVIKIVIDINL